MSAEDPLDRAPLRFLVGPTAAGKTDLAVAVARRTGATVLSMDSMLVYRGLDVGTAKPSPELLREVPHGLIDLVEPSESFSVLDYLQAARDALAEREPDARVLFVGGTAFYLKALTHGLFEGPPADPDLRRRLQERLTEEGAEALHRELAQVDAPSAERIHPNDHKRLVRALEVWEQTARPLSDWQTQWRRAGARRPGRERRLFGVDPGRDSLELRIPERTRAMLDAGWREEALGVRERCGFGPTAVQALGYAEVLQWADGELDRASCEERINLRTRQFARRQRTWFRQFPEIVWGRNEEGTNEEGPGDACVDGALEAFGW